MAFLALTFGNYLVLLALISGFVLLGPILAMAFYDISLQLQKGRTPTVAGSLRRSLHHIGNQMVFAVILLIIFLVWARAASMVHVFFPALADPSLNELATFLAIGSAVGSLFAAFVFCISAFSLPMITDRDADTVTAVVTSFNAVLRNKSAMVVWVLLIIAAVAAGLANVKRIKNTKISKVSPPSASGGSGRGSFSGKPSGGGANNFFPTQIGAIPQNTSNVNVQNLNNTPPRAYIVASDISDSTRAQEILKQKSTM